MIPILLTIGVTIAGSVCYVCFMVKNNKPKPKRKTKRENPEPVKEESRLKLEDFSIA